MARILVTDGEQRSSLAVVRSLGRAGHDVFVCSHERDALAGSSRYSRALRRVPSPVSEPQTFAGALERVVDADSIEVVIPMTDVSAPAVFEVRAQRPSLIVPFPDRGSYELGSNKHRLIEIARELGVPVPRQHVVHCPGEGLDAALAAAEALGYPVIVKPARSVVARSSGLRCFSARAVHGPDELTDTLRSLDADACPLLIQQRIVGDGLGAFFLAAEGRIFARFGHRRIRERPPMGGSTFRESIWRDDVQDYAACIIRRLGWSGVAMVEFKEDRESGTPYLMELNGRFWGSLQLAIDAGVDFPDLLVRWALGERIVPVTKFREGVRSRWLWGDVEHLVWMLRRPDAYRHALATEPPRLQALARLLAPWLPGEKPETMHWDDPAPFFTESAIWMRGRAGQVWSKARGARSTRPRHTVRFERTPAETPEVVFPRGQ